MMPSPTARTTERRASDPGRAALEGVLDAGYATPYAVVRQYGTRILVLFEPHLIRHCFITNATNYIQSAARKRLVEPILGESVLTGEGDASIKVRQQIGALFNRPALQTYAEIICEHTETATGNLEEGVHEAIALAARIALENLSLTLFSGALSDHIEALQSAFEAVYDSVGGLPLLGEEGGVAFYPSVDRGARQAAARRLHRTVRDIIEARIADTDRRGDLLDRLIALRSDDAQGDVSAERMISDVVTFLITGHETTAATVAWALFLLSRNEEALERATAESDRVTDGDAPSGQWPDRLPFVLACIEETQRLFPPVPVITRQAVNDDEVADLHIAKGSGVIVPVRLLHRMHRFWEQPERFRPERFLPGSRERIERHAYLPFGIGPRMCIGAAFGNREATIMLATILRRFRPRYAGAADPVPLLKMVMRADNGIPIFFQRRPGR